MNSEPNSQNHHQQREELKADIVALPPELESLARRLIADGAYWQSRLPDPEPVTERVRAIPAGRASLLPTSSEEHIFMFDDSDSPSPESRPAYPVRSRPPSIWQRVGNLAAVAVVLALVASAAVVFYSHSHSGAGSPGKTSTHISSTATSTAFTVTAVTMSVSPTSISGVACGTNTTVTYTAVFQVPAGSPGGTVQFTYTNNNGRGVNPASVAFSSGETSKSYSFKWSGALPADHTYPGLGGVQVSRPNQVTSKLVQPTGQCVTETAPNCGSNFTGPMGKSNQATLTSAYGTVPLPPLSSTVPDDASGGLRGYDICSAGSATSITAYMEQNLPSYGWTLVSKSGGMETWKSSSGTINWTVSNPLDWNINWRVAA
jgi:hypothetical protein